MEGLKGVHNNFKSKLDAVPIADALGASFEEMAGVKELKKLGPLVLIDSLVKAYPAYTHDKIFNLSLSMVYSLIQINKRRDYVTATAAAIRRRTMKK